MTVKVVLAVCLLMVFVKCEVLVVSLNLDGFGIDEFKGTGKLEPMAEDQERISLEVKMERPFPTSAVGNAMKVNFAYADGTVSVWHPFFPEPFVIDIGFFIGHFIGEYEMAFKGSALMVIESENTFSCVMEILHEKMPFRSVVQQIVEFHFYYGNGKFIIEEDKKDDDNLTVWANRTGL